MKNESGTDPKFSTQTPPGAGPALYPLFLTMLRETYWAENHLVKVLPVMIDAATSPKLKETITTHLGETEEQVARLETIFNLLEEKAIAKKCIAVEGLAKEGEAVIEITLEAGPVRDAGIILANQKVEHYEIAAYSGLIRLADALGLEEVAEILNQTLEEELNSDMKLTEIAANDVNDEAAEVS